MGPRDYDKLTELFEGQRPDLPCGGFYNPEFMGEIHGQREYRCYYDNFESEEDSWTWFFNVQTENFYS